MSTKRKLVTASVLAAMGLSAYAVIIHPMQHSAEYRKIHEWRANIDREKIQPGGMRIWSDPFKERPKEIPLYMQRRKKADDE